MNNKNISSLSMLAVGTTLQRGKYRIESYLASGGFGNTYVAKNLFFNETVAIKEFFMKGVTERNAETHFVSVSNPEKETQFEEQKNKFMKEARRIRHLRSDNIVAVSDLFEENGTFYYVMDYIEGESLSEMVKGRGRLPQQEAFGYFMQILDALEVVHESGIFHLDLKPANVMVDNNGKAMLIDFGASKQMLPDGAVTTETAFCFTPGYAPLEQMEQKIDKLGAWTDLYSLGATFYYLLTAKKPPMPSDINEDGEKALNFQDDIDSSLRKLVYGLMRPVPRERFQSVEQVRAWIRKNIKKPEKLPSVVKEETPEVEEVTIIQSPVAAGTVETDVSEVTGDVENKLAKTVKKGLFSKLTAMILGVAAVVFLLGILAINQCGSKSADGASPAEDTLATESSAAAVDSPKEVVDMQYTNELLGECLYTGPVDADGKPHGKGKAQFVSNEQALSYEGNFVHGVMEGPDAVYRYKNGDIFEGSFVDNHFNEGKYKSNDGNYYIGTFDANGDLDKGSWYDKDGNKL